MDRQSFASAIEQICEEKGISKEKVLETIEVAIASAYKKDYGHKGQNIRASFDLDSGAVRIFQVKQVLDESMVKTEEEIEVERKAAEERAERAKEGIVEQVPQSKVSEGEEEGEKKVRFNPERHIMIDEAKKIDKKIKVGEELLIELESRTDFGRIAAQTAKQVIIQRIREAERETIYDEYKDKEGEVVSGIVQRMERGAVFVDIGKATGVLFPEEQVQDERYRIGQRLRVLILEVQKEARGPSIILSRAHPKMLAKLFELEVPEIASGAVEIKSIAREAGSRSKIAVASVEEGVDPIGSCVGQKGTRVQAVINELGGEKIDIIEWSQDHAKFIANALAPAKVLNVEVEQEQRLAKVDVPEDQLSLAIGKRGQNVRLAAKLTEWKIDVAGAEIEEEAVKEEGEGEAEKKKKPKKEKKTIKEEKEDSISEADEEKPKSKRGRKKKAEI
jgi:N utilization substance protein A